MHVQPGFRQQHYAGLETAGMLAVVQDGQFEHRLQSGGPASMLHQRLDIGDVCLDCGSYDFPLVALGAMPQDLVCMAFIPGNHEVVRYNAQPLERDEIQVYSPGAELLYHASSASRWITLTVPESRLQATAETRLGRPLRLPSGHAASVTLPASRRAMLGRLAEDALRLGLSLQSTGIDPELARVVSQALLDAHVDALGEADLLHESAGSRAARRNLQLVLACERLMAGQGPDGLGLEDVAQRCGYSRRALEMIFRRSVGMPPGRWFMNARLNGALRDLLMPPPGYGVADIAMKWGFRHLSRFAEHYRRAFGELPSRTLARTPH
ncbi:helix-turn-helix transcriptional regulator [Jeongeupia chitinilytica]|uniref:HTH araC/xylS-type domain-containing protein n=1 Tax=Jeongeupia chitinilytica TaxID=1041641 RepID=A0ABQ3H4I6_9NEIS|nr:helix-turn-helix transcriptional regulator [Jeongeupia chitinilytica]GHD66949.1 hypothetical protein GCM10007350_29940 [Jeongeupia chitinilytica]